MENPRAEKVAVVDEVRERLGDASASVVTEYRGLTVAELADLRRNLAAVGGDYKIFKNTLVRLAIADGPHQPLQDLLTGPTGITFVHGDVSAVAKALREFARSNPHLVIKGGLVGDDVLSSSQLGALADLPSRDVLLARFAGLLQAPLAQLAGLLQALPRNLAYGLSALLDQKGGAPEAETEAPAEPAAAESAAEAEPAPAEAEASPGEAEAAAEPAETVEAAAEPAAAEAEAPAEAAAEPAAAAEAPAESADATDQ